MAEERSGSGMITAEYAAGSAAACGFACLLYLIHDFYDDLLRTILGVTLQQVKFVWPRLW